MLENIASNVWNLVRIIFYISIIVFLVTFCIDYIFNVIDKFKRNRIKDKALKDLQKNLDNLVLSLQQDKNKEKKHKPKINKPQDIIKD